MVLGCGCGVALVVCVSVVRVGVCLRGCLWRFGGVVAGVLGGFSACGVCSRLLEMADFRVPPAGRGKGASLSLVFANYGYAVGISAS